MAVTVIATGDLSPQRPFLSAGRPVWQLLADADVAFTNLEAALTERQGGVDKLVTLRCDPLLATQVAEAGVDVCTVANNHTMDFGDGGLQDTLEALDREGVARVGAGRDLAEAESARVLERGGLRIACLGFACTLPNGCGAGPGRAGLAPIRVLSRFVIDPVSIDEDPGMAPFVETVVMPGDGERAARAVRSARAQADVVLVGIHWGVPNGWVPQSQGDLATYQRPLARSLVEAGADAVIGHHPHVLHGIEVIEGRPVFYSLGNFLFHTLLEGDPALARPFPAYSWRSLRGDVNHLGGLAGLRWARPGAPELAELLPVWLDERGDPELANGGNATHAMDRVERLSEELGTRFRRSEGRLEVELG